MMVDLPSAFSITFALFPSSTATQELVVPRSIPMILNDRVRVGKRKNLLTEVSVAGEHQRPCVLFL